MFCLFHRFSFPCVCDQKSLQPFIEVKVNNFQYHKHTSDPLSDSVYWTIEAVPVPQETTTSVRPRGEHYYLHRWRGEKVKVYCDARMAGFDISKVKIVWRLQLRFLSDSGCNPRDPVITLVELVHIQGKPEEDQIYHSVSKSLPSVGELIHTHTHLT